MLSFQENSSSTFSQPMNLLTLYTINAPSCKQQKSKSWFTNCSIGILKFFEFSRN